MANDAFDYALDAIERMDYVGYSGWNQRRMEVKQRLAYAKNVHGLHLAKARSKGAWTAIFWIVGIEASIYAALRYYY